ncbi:hypothetical protein ACFSTA_07550 [Ornithinibacillus salinisoli]|uniref:Uncharacterized protein n=1 Tax=Ornithinibacillus salinisoli TaxID=1848459 RepID=A0ABW4W167_9BACI
METNTIILVVLALILLVIGWKIAKKAIRLIVFLAAAGVVIYLLKDYFM